MFQRLEPWTGRKVCDLYAGIGSLGLEALSRGAGQVTFVENDPRVLSVLRKNLRKSGAVATIVAADVSTFLAGASETFDIILADPPYGSLDWRGLWEATHGLLASGGELVMEMGREAELPAGLDIRRYGRTKVAIWRQTA